MPALILGYGNDLRGDDALGRHAARILNRRLDPAVADVREMHQLTPELSEPISQADLVIFIDARCQGQPGSMEIRAIEPCGDSSAALYHRCDPQDLLTLARELFGRCPPALLCTVSGECFDLSQQLSPLVAAALPGLVQQIQARVNQGASRVD